MNDDRSPESALRGRLADVYVPALVSGAVDALSRRLGNRATIDDPLYGRASSLASIDPLLSRVSAFFAGGGATYTHVASTTGVDRDAAEGRLSMTVDGTTRTVPIAIVAERRRLREIELRVYYAPDDGRDASRKPRSALVASLRPTLVPVVSTFIDALRKGDVEGTLGAFEENGQIVDTAGVAHPRSSGKLASFVSDLGAATFALGGAADDGRTCCLEVTIHRPNGGPSVPALFAFERGDSGLVHELRVYWE